MEERSLRITGTSTNFFNKLTNTLTKILIPTKISINGMLISMKRNNLIKAFANFKKDTENYNSEELEKKYEDAYTVYLEALDKYVMDSIYKKVKNNTATEFERDALARYYEVTSLKEKEYMDYKYRKQKYLLELDKESVNLNTKEKIQEKYNKFYVNKMDTLYKGILKNYSIKLADTSNIYDSSKEWIYVKIFYTLEEYIKYILPLKMEINPKEEFKDIVDDYEKFESYTVGKLDTKDNIEKNMILLGISRKLFTHSIPLIVAEQCYIKLLKETRDLIVDTRIKQKKMAAYKLLIDLIEDYNMRLLSTKIYWDKPAERDYYKKFWNEYKSLQPLKEEDEEDYEEQKEILFIRNDLKKLCEAKNILRYEKIIKFYKEKLVSMGAMRNIKNSCKTIGNYTKQKQIA